MDFDALNDDIIDKLYQLKSEGFFYLEDTDTVLLIKNIENSDNLELTYLEKLLDIFFKNPNEIDTLRLHLAFRKSGNSHRYKMKRKLYDLFIDNRAEAVSQIDVLRSLL
ncbi:hypothetical protein BN85400140 [Alteracholeplasma palmae J233]|uniref:Uncharacterized protein n=1 Tax=Alteracholeplasma palmae (strain ATCC 49389 / J233) TaxID=1318466 RepID=U4KQT6_ALTPJ|nr:hypothetical protein [Alteracholeplasma palmae]CCV63591.1 hypothetical protein BN85400140 [Alteracholeplasma palmae J233]